MTGKRVEVRSLLLSLVDCACAWQSAYSPWSNFSIWSHVVEITLQDASGVRS